MASGMGGGIVSSDRKWRTVVAALAAGWLALAVVVDVLSPPTLHLANLFPVAASIACAALPAQLTAVYAGAALALGFGSGYWNHVATELQQFLRLVEIVVIGAAAVVVALARVREVERQARLSTLAAAAQGQLISAAAKARDAAEINDSIIQGMAVAKWSLTLRALPRSTDRHDDDRPRPRPRVGRRSASAAGPAAPPGTGAT